MRVTEDSAHLSLDCQVDNDLHCLILQKLILLFTLAAACALAQSRVYELRTYHVYEGKLEALKANFRDHHIATFKRHGIESIGY